MKTSTPIGMCIVLVVTAGADAGGILFVDDDAPPGGDGSSWATAHRFLHDGLSAALEAGAAEIRIGAGSYRPDRSEAAPSGSGDREAAFALASDLAVRGGYAGFGAPDPDERDIDAFPTVLSGDLLGDDEPGFGNVDDNSYQVVTAQSVTGAVLDGVTVIGGNANGAHPLDCGGGLYAIGGSLSLVRCRFVTCRGEDGGAVFLSADATLANCVFDQNVAEDPGGTAYGGALWISGGTTTATDCHFTGCSADRGGAVGMQYSELTFAGCHFNGNVADQFGGAVRTWSGSVSMSECVCLNNSASDGGAAAIYSNDAAIIDCHFESNSALDDAGALFLAGDDAEIGECTFAANECADDGAALYILGGVFVTIHGCEFENGDAADDGGAIYLQDESEAIIVDCSFLQNDGGFGAAIGCTEGSTIDVRGSSFVEHDGGVVVACGDESLAFVRDCEFLANEPGTGGAVVRCQGQSELHVSDCQFIGGDHAPPIFLIESSTAHVARSTFAENASSGAAAAAIASGSHATFVACVMRDNFSTSSGGAVGVGTASAVLDCCLLVGNRADDGGGVHVAEGSLTVRNCTIVSNIAEDGGDGDGGGIRLFKSTASIVNTILWGNVDDAGGAEGAQITLAFSSAQVDYSCVEGLTGALGGRGNIGDDPAFVDAPLGDYRLTAGSPALDAGLAIVVPPCLLDLDGHDRFVVAPGGSEAGDPGPVDLGAYELGGATLPDCDADGLEDDCALAFGMVPDCNGNGIPDSCDLDERTSTDCNHDRIPDECQLDCNGNGVPDTCDLDDGTSSDCNDNGIPDECDLADGTSEDCNSNGIPDECDLEDDETLDCDGNGVIDSCDPDEPDCNGNGVADVCDVDCNGNSVPDTCEIADGLAVDCNDNGILDDCEIGQGYSINDSHAEFSVGNNFQLIWGTQFEAGSATAVIERIDVSHPDSLSLGDAVTVFIWDDPNDDGQPDDVVELAAVEGTVQTVNDPTVEGDYAFDSYEFPPTPVSGSFFVGLTVHVLGNSPALVDSTGAEIGRNWFWGNGGDTEGFRMSVPLENGCGCAGNWLIRAAVTDCNANAVPDGCDLDDGTIEDSDGDGVPDDCDTSCPTDTDGNGVTDVVDLITVVVVWGTDDQNGDVNGDGIVDVQDLVSVILAWGPCPGG